MITLFDVLQWGAAFGGMLYGVRVGARFGWVGVIGGGLVGFVGGSILGRVPWVISRGWYRWHLKRTSTEELKSELKEQYYVSHLLIAELVIRGEPVEQFWPYVLSQVRGEFSDERRFGWENLRIWFPRMAQQVEGFDPCASTEACREKLKAIEAAEADARPLFGKGA